MAIYPDLKTARFNLREAVKQMLHLEFHLSDQHKQCPDCITKHAFMLEGLIDEGFGLSGADSWRNELDTAKQLSQDVNASLRVRSNPYAIAEMIRQVRKPLMLRVGL